MMTEQAELSAKAKRDLRLIVETYYDVQNVRNATEHRIRHYADHEGLVAVLGEVAAEQKKLEGIPAYKKAIRDHRKDEAFAAASLTAASALEDDEHHAKVNKLMRQQEAILKRKAMVIIKDHPLWTDWLSAVYGIGPCLGGGILARIQIENCRYVSQLWKYAGLGVTMNGWKCHACGHQMDHHPSLLQRGVRATVMCPQCQNPMAAVGHADRREKGKKLTFNPHLKTLFWKVGESFVKLSPEKSGYRKLYDKFRAEIDQKIARQGGYCHKEHKDQKGKVIQCFDAHRFAMAKRKTVKVFAAHIYLKWRTLLGLPTDDPWIFWDGSGHGDYIQPIYDMKENEKTTEG